MKQIFAKLNLVWILTAAATSALADPPRPSHDHWRNTTYQDHYIRYDHASRKYIETVNCKVLWRFNLLSNELNTLTLHDPSRNMTVRLDYTGMYLKAASASTFTLYQRGTFDTRTHFNHYDQNGTYTGSIAKLDGCTWVERSSGQSQVAYRFVQRSASADSIELYDGSRDIWVSLKAKAMYLRFGSNAYQYFKNGSW